MVEVQVKIMICFSLLKNLRTNVIRLKYINIIKKYLFILKLEIILHVILNLLLSINLIKTNIDQIKLTISMSVQNSIYYFVFLTSINIDFMTFMTKNYKDIKFPTCFYTCPKVYIQILCHFVSGPFLPLWKPSS